MRVCGRVVDKQNMCSHRRKWGEVRLRKHRLLACTYCGVLDPPCVRIPLQTVDVRTISPSDVCEVGTACVDGGRGARQWNEGERTASLFEVTEMDEV